MSAVLPEVDHLTEVLARETEPCGHQYFNPIDGDGPKCAQPAVVVATIACHMGHRFSKPLCAEHVVIFRAAVDADGARLMCAVCWADNRQITDAWVVVIS